MTKPFVLGVDLDGVCADYVDAFRNFVAMRKRVAINSIGPATDWSFHKVVDWPIDSMEEYLELHAAFVAEGGFIMERPLPGVSKALWELSDAGVYIRIVTHRLINSGSYSSVIADTARWLETHDIPFRGIAFERHKADTGCDLYIDDSPSNLRELQTAGKKTIVFDAPYNRPPVALGVRVESWAELTPLVLKVAANGCL